MKKEKTFISGEDLLKRWDIAKDKLFEYVSDASREIEDTSPCISIEDEDGITIQKPFRRWILRPHHPDTLKEVIYADGHPWPKCREVGGNIIENNALPEYDSSLEKGIKWLDQYLYLMADVEAIEKAFPELIGNKEPTPETKQLEPDTITTKAENYFKRSGEFWQIGHEGKHSKPISHVDGLLYIAYLLQRRGQSLSWEELSQAKNGQCFGKISIGEAMDNDLNTRGGTQNKNDHKAKINYFKEYQKLQNDLERTDDFIIKKEIEKQMEELLSRQKEKNLPDPEKKKGQNNIRNRINTAYDHLEKSGMKELVKHLKTERYIRTDGDYSFSYVGSLVWDIMID